jgi:hypothetical protein
LLSHFGALITPKELQFSAQLAGAMWSDVNFVAHGPFVLLKHCYVGFLDRPLRNFFNFAAM